MTYAEAIGSGNPNVFDVAYSWYNGAALPLEPGEQAILARGAHNYVDFAPAVTDLRPAAQRWMEGQRLPDDPEPLGGDNGLSSLAYRFSYRGDPYVVRFSKEGTDADMVRLRLRNLARAANYRIPHVEQLVAHSIPEDSVITRYAPGLPTSELTPDDISRIPHSTIAGLRAAALSMEDAGVMLDIKWGAEGVHSEEPFDLVVGHYERAAGPTFFDIIAREEEPNTRTHEAGQIYAELLTSMVATGTPLDPNARRYQQLHYKEVSSRLMVFDQCYRLLQALWPNSPGLSWLKRTAGRMIQTLLPSEQTQLEERHGKHLKLPLGYRQRYDDW